MAAYLVTGNPGSGKTAIAGELSGRGFTALDADYDPELSHWETVDGPRVALGDGPADPDRAWLTAHRWVWNRGRLAELAATRDPTFICGIALNIDQVIDLFDRVFLLHISATTQEERLDAHDVMNPPGRNDAQRQQIRDGRPHFEAEMTALGAVVIDAAQSSPVVADEILAHCAST